MFCPNTGMKFREPYHLNHVIPRLEYAHLHSMAKTSVKFQND